MKICAEIQLDVSIGCCCIGIPIYLTYLERRAAMDIAASIGGLHPLRLMHETTATALAYGIIHNKTDLPENEQLNVAFVDIGHASMQICIAGLKKGQLKILAHSFDRCLLGGRDFDKAFFQHLAAKFKTEYKIDVDQEKKASLTDCEKKKKDLSGKTEANLNMKGLMDNKDVTGFLKRDEFEEISIHILERVKKPLQKAAQFTIDSIHAVEVMGSGSTVPAVIKILREFFGKEPRPILDSNECVVKGCGLECTMLTPSFKVEEFKVQVIFPFPIALTWQGYSQESHNGNVENQQRAIVFPKGSPIPSVKALTFYTSGTFTVDVQYADVIELQAPLKINTYTIGPFQATKGERAKVKLEARLNLHGIVSLIEEEEVEVPVKNKEATKMDTDKAPADVASAIETDVNTQETDAKVEAPKKEAVSEAVSGPVDVQKAVDKECEMVSKEAVMDEKDAVETFYVFEMRNKLCDTLQEFGTESDKKALIVKLQETEDWLLEDGKNEIYVAKHDELKKLGEKRYKEHTERGEAPLDRLIKSKPKLAPPSPAPAQEGEDRISSLPGHLILSFLDRVPIEDAVRTSALSKEWRYIWMEKKELVFDRRFFERFGLKSIIRREDLSIITYILQHRQTPISMFCLYWSRGHYYKVIKQKIRQWIKLLSKIGVTQLVITGAYRFYQCPSYMFSCLKLTKLILGYCLFKPPPGFEGFPNLEYLHLEVVFFGDELSETVIFLPQLKHLHLSFCTNQWNFNINAPKLKHLTVPFCLDTSWLVRLLDNSPCITVRIEKPFKEEDIKPVERRSLDIILSKLPMVEDLHFHASFFENLTIPKSLPAPFTSLKHLGFDHFDLSNICHLQGMLFLLRSSPNLESLTLRGFQTPTHYYYYHDDDDDDLDFEVEGPTTYALEAFNSTFSRLETVEMEFLKGLREELLFIKVLLADSPSLKMLKCMKSRKFIDAQDIGAFAKYVMQFPRASTEAKLLLLCR